MSFSKSFPRTNSKSSYPVWEEIFLNSEEESLVEEEAYSENIKIMKKCLDDAKLIISNQGLKPYQTDIVNLAISLFEKNSSHLVYWKESKCNEKFDKKYKL